jgi:hypothetical protein
MHLVRALEEIEKRQGVELLEFGEGHDFFQVGRASEPPKAVVGKKIATGEK